MSQPPRTHGRLLGGLGTALLITGLLGRSAFAYGLCGGLGFGLLIGLSNRYPARAATWSSAVIRVYQRLPVLKRLPWVRMGVAATLPTGRFAWRVPGRSRWRQGLAYGLAWVVLSMGGFAQGVWFGLFGLLVGLAFGLMYGLATNADDRLALGQDARRVIHDDLVAALVGGLVFGVFIVFAIWLSIRVWIRPPVGPIVWLVLTGVLCFWLTIVLGSAAGRYASVSLLFAFTENFARRPAQFLEWARGAGLLRVSGIAYQFRHDSYQQWLAAGDAGRGVKTTPDAQAG